MHAIVTVTQMPALILFILSSNLKRSAKVEITELLKIADDSGTQQELKLLREVGPAHPLAIVFCGASRRGAGFQKARLKWVATVLTSLQPSHVTIHPADIPPILVKVPQCHRSRISGVCGRWLHPTMRVGWQVIHDRTAGHPRMLVDLIEVGSPRHGEASHHASLFPPPNLNSAFGIFSRCFCRSQNLVSENGLGVGKGPALRKWETGRIEVQAASSAPRVCPTLHGCQPASLLFSAPNLDADGRPARLGHAQEDEARCLAFV
jgi:hypothetical protein